jgi:hypothetical protein
MINHFLNGNPCNPQNRTDIRYKIDHSDRTRVSGFEITVDNLIFVNEDKQAIEQWLSTYGNFVGMPYNIQFSNGQTRPYIIDFTQSRWNCTEFHAKIIPYRANLNFFNRANALSWRLVNWQPSDFTNVQYIIIQEQQPLYFITLGLALFSTAQMLAKSIREISEGISDLSALLPPLPANIGQVVAAAIKLAARIAEAIALTIAMVRLMQQIIEMIMPKVRTFRDIPYLKLIEKGCQHLGYSVDFTDIEELRPLAFLGSPEKNLNGGWFREIFMPLSLALSNGFPTEMDAIPTLGQSIERLEELFCLRTKVANGVVRIERRNNQNTLQTPIPLAYNEQELMQQNTQFNNEYYKRKVIHWAKDTKDVWTYDQKTGHLTEVDARPSIIPNDDRNLDLLKGGDVLNTPFAFGWRKNELTRVEKFLKTVLAPAVDVFTNGGFTQMIDARIGVMVISSQYFTVNKLLWKQEQKLASNHREKLSARYILENYHNTETVTARNLQIIENMPIRMTENLFLQFSNQNIVTLQNGSTAEIRYIEWSEHDHEASATLLVANEYNINIQETTIYG